MNYTTLDLRMEGQLARLTLNRPEAVNCIDLNMSKELREVAIALGKDPEVRAVLLDAAGDFFCAGGDLNGMSQCGDNIDEMLMQTTTDLHAAISRLARMDKPLIAAVQGFAAGAGFSMAIMADYTLASDQAKFTMAYTAAGLAPDGSSSYFLPRLIGERRAKELMLTNRTLSAEEALDWGLVNRVVAHAELAAEAEAFAQKLASGPTRSYGMVKQLLSTSFQNGLETQMELESRAIASCGASDDGREGITAFLEKRKPVFRGR